ncbi:hypothetical protein [Microbacterium sp. BLY]|uniref:hypothetical protein n=1 Tax=Microbacterium sp. BLY TaxID=2823280 RepID=UPI001B33308D|nr:hypothetical protein [Microbacterium sp. BLY]MBP3976925.1 hypothetical protein [Microbacterium sp. BLY]
MNISDDEIDRLFRAANPAPASSERLSAHAIAVRESIIRGTHAPAQERQGWAWGRFAVAVAAIVAIVVVVTNVIAPTQQAIALTPPPLQYTNPQPLSSVVQEAKDRLGSTVPVDQERRVSSLVWGWSIDMAKEKIESVPQVIMFEWAPATGSRSTIVAGEPYWPDGVRPEGIEASPYKPGDTITELITAPEDLKIPADVVNLNDASRESVDRALTSLGVRPSSPSGEVLVGIGRLLSYWTLTNEQHAALIDRLIDAGGVTVLGSSTDRLGRDVIGLRVTDPATDYQDTVLISRDTGRIVGMENELTVAQDVIPAGVVGYTLWDVE